jgi:hypothetical protein
MDDVSACAPHFGVTAEEIIHSSLFQSGEEEDSAAIQMDIWILKKGGLGMVMN